MLSRRSVVLAAIAASAALTTPAAAIEPRAFDAKAFAAAQQAGKPILVAVHASWCPTCKAQKPILSELMAEPKFKDLIYFVVDFDTQNGRTEAEAGATPSSNASTRHNSARVASHCSDHRAICTKVATETSLAQYWA